MASVNKVIIVGNLGTDPEVRQFPNGGSVTHITVATSERWTDKQTGQPKEQTEWHRISLFNRLGEVAAQYLRKGSSVYIEGSLHTRKWTDQQNVERYSTEIKASTMQMLGGNPNAGNYRNDGQNFNNYNQGYQNGAPAQPFTQPNQGYPQNPAYQNAPPAAPAQNNQFMNQPPQAPQGAPKAVTPPVSEIADDDMPF